MHGLQPLLLCDGEKVAVAGTENGCFLIISKLLLWALPASPGPGLML